MDGWISNEMLTADVCQRWSTNKKPERHEKPLIAFKLRNSNEQKNKRIGYDTTKNNNRLQFDMLGK